MKRLKVLFVILFSSVIFTGCMSAGGGAETRTQTVAAYDELVFDDVAAKVEAKESFFLLAHSETCPPCIEFLPLLETYLNKNNQAMASLETTEYGYNLYELVGDDFQYTPTILVFVDGEVVETFVGVLEDSELDAMMKKYPNL